MDKELLTDKLPENWIMLTEEEVKKFTDELVFEICDTHELFGKNLTALARRWRRDDFLFASLDAPDGAYVVHLTWRKETDPYWPAVLSFKSVADFCENWSVEF